MLSDPPVHRETKAQPPPQPVGQPPVQEMFLVREYTPTELIDTTAKFCKKPRRVSSHDWCVLLWNTLDT